MPRPPTGHWSLMFKRVVYPADSIVKQKDSAYCRTHDGVCDWSRIWYFDGSVQECEWAICDLVDGRRLNLFNMGYEPVTWE